MENVKIEIDIIAAKFIVTAILFQKEGGVIFENDTTEGEFLECYGFSRKQLKRALDKLRNQIPLNKSIREKMFQGGFDGAKITIREL